MGTAQPSPDESQTGQANEAVLLIRAMIASANADGMIDAEERNKILEKLEAVGLTDEERSFIANEMLSPAGAEEIAAAANEADLGRQAYAASLLAIEVDTDAERAYLNQLESLLNLDEDTVAEICSELGVERPVV